MKERFWMYRYWVVGGVLVVIGMAFWGISRMYMEPSEVEAWTEQGTAASSEVRKQAEQSEEPNELYIDIKGAVNIPGVYQVRSGMRVWDALELAGGMNTQADRDKINLSQKLEDQMVIYVPAIGEEVNSFMMEEREQENTGRVDLNTAGEQDLMSLSGIGLKKAQEIINYREEKGRFTSVDELKDIPGIGEKTIEKLKEQVFVS